MDRRIQKARRILKDASEGIQDGMADFLDVAADMVDETHTYPRFTGLVDLDDLDDDEYNEILDAHEGEGLEEALSRWTGLVDRQGGRR